MPALSRTRQIPQLPGHWMKGNLTEYRTDRLGFYERLRCELGDFAGFRLGPKRMVLVTAPESLREVFVTRNREFGRSFSTKMLGQFFGEGLLISEGVRWLKDRRLIQPSFTRERIQGFASPMVRHTEKFLESLHSGGKRDILIDMQVLTMKIAAETLLGVSLEEEVDAIHEPHEIIRDSFDRRMKRTSLIPQWLPTAQNRKVAAANRTIRDIVHRLILKRRTSNDPGEDILSRLIHVRDEQGHALTDRQVADQTLTFLFAGHETTASVLAWIWYLLGSHPDAESRLVRELDTVLCGQLPCAEDLSRLRFCEYVIKEALRLYPSAYVMSREVNADCSLSGYQLSKGTTLVASPWVMQRDERFFDCPLEFRPQRWADHLEGKLHQFAWFPFGAGPRVCIGRAFALLELVLVVAAIASRVRLRLLPGQTIRPHASVTIRPSPAVYVEIQARTHGGPDSAKRGTSSSQICQGPR